MQKKQLPANGMYKYILLLPITFIIHLFYIHNSFDNPLCYGIPLGYLTALTSAVYVGLQVAGMNTCVHHIHGTISKFFHLHHSGV